MDHVNLDTQLCCSYSVGVLKYELTASSFLPCLIDLQDSPFFEHQIHAYRYGFGKWYEVTDTEIISYIQRYICPSSLYTIMTACYITNVLAQCLRTPSPRRCTSKRLTSRQTTGAWELITSEMKANSFLRGNLFKDNAS
jgi:hypothetical protein